MSTEPTKEYLIKLASFFIDISKYISLYGKNNADHYIASEGMSEYIAGYRLSKNGNSVEHVTDKKL